MDGCEDALELFKASIYYVYFKDLPDDLIIAALTEAECLPGAVFMLESCPKVYCKYLISAAQCILFDLVRSVSFEDGSDDPVIEVESPGVRTVLKKRKILDVECEWEQVKSCLDCDSDIRNKVAISCDKWVDLCKTACAAFGLGVMPHCHDACYTCEGGKVRRLGGSGEW